MIVFGSRVLWNDLLAHGLIDELHFMIGTVLLDNGTPMFLEPITYNDPKRSLQIMDSRTFKGSENLLVQQHVKYNRGAQGHES